MSPAPPVPPSQRRPSGRNSVGAAGRAAVDSQLVCVVYHSRTGEVVHVHHVVNLKGAKATGQPEAEARALELALSVGGGRDRAELRTLFASHEDLRPGRQYRVDLQTRKLVGAERANKHVLGHSRPA